MFFKTVIFYYFLMLNTKLYLDLFEMGCIFVLRLGLNINFNNATFIEHYNFLVLKIYRIFKYFNMR